MVRKNALEIAFFMGVILFCAFMLWQATDLKFVIHDQVGPGVYPTVFLLILLIISIVLLIRVVTSDYIRIFSPFLSGLNEDLLIRRIGTLLSEKSALPVRVSAKNGTGRFSALWAGLKARSDGKTLIVISSELNELPNLYAASHACDNVTPLARIFFFPDVLMVGSDSEVNSLREFIDMGNSHRSPLRIGVLHHPKVDYSVEKWLEQRFGLSFEAVSDDDYMNLKNALLDGTIDALICPVDEASEDLTHQHTLNPLGVMSDHPLNEYPSIPTFSQIGHPFISGKWAGVAVPKGVPSNVCETLSKHLTSIFNDKDSVDSLSVEGVALNFLNCQDFLTFLQKQKDTLEELNHSHELPTVESGKYFGLNLSIGLTFLFILAMNWLGFPLTAFLFLTFTMISLSSEINLRKIGKISTISLSVSLILYFVFWQIFYVVFPGPRLFGG